MTGTATSPVVGVVTRATTTSETLGHENLGPLSWERGFVPVHDPATALPVEHRPWDAAAAALPDLFRRLELRKYLRDLPLLGASEDALPDTALGRAATVLGFLAHSYVHVTPTPRPDIPPVILQPWRQVLQRLGRSEDPVLSYYDLIVANWRLRSAHSPNPLTVPNLRLLVTAVDNEAEQVFYLTQLEILACAAPILTAVAQAQQAVLADDAEQLLDTLHTITATLNGPVRRALRQINPRPGAATHVDPVLWAKTVAPFAVPYRSGVLGPSGTASPVFSLLDAFLGRTRHESRLGREIACHRASYPFYWRELLDAVEQVPIPPYAASRGDPPLIEALHELVDAYAGHSGFLGRHRRKVFGYLEIAFKVGRDTTIGGFSGEPVEREWLVVDDALDESRQERLAPALPALHPRRTSGSSAGRAGNDVVDQRCIPVTELLAHTGDDGTWWFAVQGHVVDLTAFLTRHPGGADVLKGYAGLDATSAFRRAHAASAGVDRLREQHTIGLLKHPAINAEMRPFYNKLLSAAYATIELRHVLRLDRSLAAGSTLVTRHGREPAAYEVDRAHDALRRFRDGYLPRLQRDVLEPLVRLTATNLRLAHLRPAHLRLARAHLRVPPRANAPLLSAHPDAALLRSVLDDVDAWLTDTIERLRQALLSLEKTSARRQQCRRAIR